MIKIYHNPRCRKSREGLEIIENSGKDFEIIKYLEDIPTDKELQEIIKLLDIDPIDLIRKGEQVWKDNYKGQTLTDSALIKAMAKYPKLIERPIVINNHRAVIGRPPERILDII